MQLYCTRYFKRYTPFFLLVLAIFSSISYSHAQCTPYKKSIVISTSTGDIDLAEVDGNNITVTKKLNFGSYVWGDVAVDNHGDVYVVDFNSGNLFKTNFNGSGLSFIMNIPKDSIAQPNSLMFLPDGTLLVGNGLDSSKLSNSPATLVRQSSIYRVDLSTKKLNLWHSFGGISVTSGDFANYNGDVYVAWSQNHDLQDTSSYLYKVKVDNNYNFVSYTNLGKENTDCFGTNPPYGLTYICGSGILAARNSVLAYLDITDPTKCTSVTYTGVNGDIYGLASFADVNPGLCTLQDCPLPVSFGNISASVTNNNLTVNWQTLTETNNDHFEVEVSKDGKTFTKAGIVISQAKDGNSTQIINYNFTQSMNAVSYAGLSVLGIGAFLLLILNRRNKNWGRLILAAGITLFSLGCNKQNDIKVNANEKIMVRIKQIDKDGKNITSKTVQAVAQ